MALTRHLLLIDVDGSAVSAGDLVLVVDLPPATQGVAYAGLLSATGGVAPYTFSETGTLPTGLSLDATTGELTGTPTALGYFEFTATVTDSAPTVKSKVVAIKVSSTIIVGGVLPPGEVGIAYSSGLSASGGTPPFTWSLLSGSLPGGLGPINSSTGIIAGTPTTPGVYNFTIRATDSASSTQDFPTSITVYAAVDLSTSTFPAGIVGVPYNAGPTTIGGVAPFTYSISSGAIPAGCTFSTTSGFVSGQPTTVATYTFHVTVLDALGGTSTYNASVAVTAGGGGGSGVTSVNGATGVVTETSNDGSLGHTDTAGSGGNIDWTARLLAKLVTVAALPANTYANGSSGVGATLTGNATGTLTVDGVLVALNDFVLVTQEASGLKCGLYKCTTAGAVGVAYVLTRATRMDSTGKYVGAQVFITGGSTGAIRVYACSNQTSPTVGTTAITFNAITFASGVNGTFSNMSATILNGIVTAAANGSATYDVQIFNAGSGTWTKPPNAKQVRAFLLGAGGGGGGGILGGGNNRLGAGGGGGGAGIWQDFDVTLLGSTESVSVGAGGSPGAGGTSASPAPGASAGGNTSFGGVTAYGGGGGGGAAAVGAAGGGSGGLGSAGGNGQGAIGTAGNLGGIAAPLSSIGVGNTSFGGGTGAGAGATGASNPGGSAIWGGAGGGSGNALTGAHVGGVGGIVPGALTPAAGGTIAGVGAQSGSNPTAAWAAGSAGGGGGANTTGAASAAGNGARGSGGGGGGSSNGSTAGFATAGGTGGDGICVVFTACST